MAYRGNQLGFPAVSLRREIDRLFEDVLGRGDTARGWVPAVDVTETGSELRLDVELPGIRPEDVDVTFENGVLAITGEKREERKEGEEEGRFHVIERSYGTFTRAFQLPQGVDSEGIDAEFQNGVLRIRIPKPEQQKARRIQIGGEAQKRVAGEVRSGGQSRSQSTESGRKSSGRTSSRGREEGMAAKGRGSEER